VPPVPTATPIAPAVMRAETDRGLGAAQAGPPGVDLEALRRGIVNDLMHQLRTEFERGG
jgi:hypothetical protein